jgi:hypothetical protein
MDVTYINSQEISKVLQHALCLNWILIQQGNNFSEN